MVIQQLRYSRQRDLIYKYLENTKNHPTAEDIYIKLKSEIANLSLATVYRNLKVLEELGKVKRLMVSSTTVRYDANIENHAHLICEKCSRVFDIEMDNMTDISALYKHSLAGAKISNVVLSFTGVCRECMRSNIQ